MVLKLFVVLLCMGVIFVMSLGIFIDVTQPPRQADLIVSLGGDSGCRIQKALALYQEGYATSQKILYTGSDWLSKRLDASMSKREYLMHHGVDADHIVHVDMSLVSNTMEEVYFIRHYMLKHRYSRVMFVSHPQHSRRIAALAQLVADYRAEGLAFEVVSCNPRWWNRTWYFRNETALKASLRELAKLVYNVVKYATPLRHYTRYAQEHKEELWERATEQLP